jgi:hypothetical protein
VTLPVAPNERRASARVPLDRPVRIGRAGGLPYASVSARDLSAGGLFIDAERSVRVGARFSVEVPLEGGDRVYVSEAEVVDNRRREDGGGFGVRFVSLSADARALLEAEVAQRAYVTLRSGPREDEPSGFDIGEAPTIGPELGSLELPSSEVGDDVQGVDAAMGSVIPSGTGRPEVGGPTMRVRARTRWSKMKAWMRSIPALSGVLYALGAAALLVVAVAVVADEPAPESVELEASPRGAPPAIFDTVVEGTAPGGLVRPEAREPEGEVVHRLPEREAPARRASASPGGALEGPEAAAGAGEEAARAPDAAPAARSGRAGEEAEKAPAPRPAGRPRRAPEENAARAPAAQVGRAVLLDVPLAAAARIKTHYVLRKPERFVVDLVGVRAKPELPAPGGRVRRVRFGRHDGFVRIVVDAAARIASGEARMAGDHLKLSLRFD